MLIKSYKAIFSQELSNLYDTMEIESFFYITLENFHAIKRIDLALQPELKMDAEQLVRWERVLTELKKQKPIQYIIGETQFYGLPFLVNNNTLIPRPETEELVELIINDNIHHPTPNIQLLDIGSGSGCIAIALANNLPSAQVTAIDISEKALAIAQKNAEINKVNVNFIQADILKTNDLKNLPTPNFHLPTKYDVIVSNPPYVRNLEKAEIKPNVLEYEPHIALFVDNDDALLFYRKIGALAKMSLAENGKLYFEINQYLGKETVELLENLGFNTIVLKKDSYGNDRMISCTI